MLRSVDIIHREDDWTGLASAAERRKIQNRLHQRLYRERRKAKSSKEHELRHWTACRHHVLPDFNSSSQTHTSLPCSCLTDSPGAQPSEDIDVRAFFRQQLGVSSIQQMNWPQLLKAIALVESRFRDQYMLGSPRVDQILTLVQFNVLRALFSNAFWIDCAQEWCQDDTVSPWCSPSGETRRHSCPPNLLPTALQRQVPHHPWIDLFPFPRIRDNLLLADDAYDELALCNDLVDFVDVTHEETGLIVWGEPWSPSGWEVTETFLRRWGWVVEGCAELFASTNYWRTQRGEKELPYCFLNMTAELVSRRLPLRNLSNG